MLEALAGKRQANRLAAAITNIDRVKEAYEVAQNASGSAAAEQERFSQSIQYSLDRLKASGQELAYNLLDSGALKAATELLVSFTNAINAVTEATDGLIPVLAGAGLAFYAFNTVTGLTKNLVSGAQALQGFFEKLTTDKIADTLATEANTQAENRNAAAKLKSAAANEAAALAQAEETAADITDSMSGVGIKASQEFLSPDEWMASMGGLGASASTATLAIGGLVAILAAAGATAYMVYQRNEQLKESASQLASAYTASTAELDGYKEQISNLYDTINDSTTSYEDAKAAREQLLSIQDALIAKYGEEAGNIDLVTQAVDGQIEALDQLRDREWQRTKTEFNKKAGLGILDSINQTMHGASSNMEVMEDEVFDAKIKVRATAIDDKELLQQMEETLGGEYEVDMNAGILTLSGDLDDVKDKLYQIQDAAEKVGASDNFMSGLTKNINDVEDTLSKYGEMADQWVFNEKVMPSYSDQFHDMQNAYQEYRDAVTDNNAELIQQSKDNIIEVFGSLRSSGADKKVLDYFRNMYPELKSEIGSWELGQDLQNKTLDDIKAGAADAISKFSSLEELKNAQNSADEETQKSYRIVEDLANHYGMTVDALISKVKELGGLPIGFNVNQEAIGRFGQAMSRRGSTYNETESQRLDSAINESEYRNQINTFGEAYWDKIAEKIDEAHKANNGLELSQQQVNAAVKQGTEEYIAEAEAAEKVAAGLNESLSSSDLATNLVDQYDKAFKAIGSAYQDLVEKKFDLSKVDLSSITAIKDAIKDLQSNLSVDGIDFNTEAYEHLLDVVTNTASSSEQIKAAFDNMGTALISSLDGVTEENYKVAESFLQTHGVVDASLGAFMAYANGIDEAKAKTLGLVDANGRVSGSTASAEEALVAEMYAGQNTSDALEYLRVCMQNVSLQGIDISNALAALQDLEAQARATGSSITAITGMQNAAKAYATATNAADRKRLEGRYKLLQAAQTNAYNKQLEEIQNRQKVNPSNYGGSGSGSKSGGGGGGSAKDTKEQTDALKELSSQLDEIQAAYSSLSEIVKSYNENGKLTIDQAQELINTDFRYLAMLTDEGGQLRLNEQGFQDLAKAKLQEMQIQLARNAIDAVNNLKTEADAVNFLTYAYEGLAGAALDATEAQLKMAVAAAHARDAQQGGTKIGEAADKILAGYNATKQAIGNVDLSSGSLAGKKDEKSKDDKDKKDTEKKQEDTKTRFNWLDQLVNKIQRTIDQLAKRAEKYFNYQEKNALVDKQLAANQRMINTQELSVDYYQNKASKALKKVPKKYRNLVSGDFDPATVKKLVQDIGSSKTEKLQEYMNWQELLEKAQDALSEAYDQERNLIASKLDNILDYFDTLIDYQQNMIKNIQASRELATAQGQRNNINSLMSEYAKHRETVETASDKQAAYEAAAAAAMAATKQSYANQISNTATDYQNTTSYQKLKDNKKKQAATKRALNSTYQVLAEDVDAFIAANKTYEAGKNKKTSSKKYQKAMEAKKVMDQLHKKYTDYLAELQREESEALASQSAALANQKYQLDTDVKNAAIDMWNVMHSILDEMGSAYDDQIAKLSVIISKYTTIADLLKDIDRSTVESYGVGDMFDITTYGDATRTNALSEAIKNTKDMINQYKQQYQLYSDLIGAVESSSIGTRQSQLLAILNRNDLSADSKQIAQQIATQLANNNWETNTAWVDTWKENLSNIISAVADAIKQVEDYGDELADSVTQSTQRIIDSLYLLQQAYASKASLINDNWVMDTNGLTDYGYAKISALSQEIDIARQRADQYRQQIADIAANRDNYSTTDDYNEAYNTAVKNYYDALSDAYSTQNEVYELAKKIATAEVDSISKLIENYKKALNAKKAYYDYDKQLRDKNKNIQTLTAEINALTGVSDAASKARLKSLQAELEEAQQDLDDTVFDHSIQVESDALDKLIEDMTNALNDSTKTIQQTFEDFAKTVSSVMEAAGKADTGSIYDKVINFIMTGSTAGKYYDNGIDTTEGTVSHTTTTSDTSSTTVADELENGSLVPVTLGNTLTGIDSHLLSVLAQVTDSQKLQTTMANNMNYLPNISAKVDSIASGVGSIASNTSTIAGQLSNIQNTLSKNGYGGKYLNLNSLSSYQLNQLRKLGITRIYY